MLLGLAFECVERKESELVQSGDELSFYFT